MFERIVYISDHSANVKLVDGFNMTTNLMNLHIIFEDSTKKILGEVDDLDGNLVRVRFLGEIVNGKLLGGVIRKPSLDAKIRVIQQDEIPMICGNDAQGYLRLGVSPFYNDYPVFLDVNNFFSNHFAIFGNSGSGKSCGISRLLQNMFHDQRLFPYKANIVLFDSSGEYYNAFKDINKLNSNYHYRFYSTNEVESAGEKLRIPIFLLNESDLALLLQATNHSQLPIIERMLKLALVFSQTDMDANNYKNHLIAKAIMTILYTNETSPNKRNEIFSILASCSTPEFNLEAVVQGVGYTRKFRECFLIDSQGQFSESVLLTEYVSSFIKDEYDNYEPRTGVFYTLDTLEKALNFTLISEGWLRNENTYGDAVTIKVRLHALIVGQNSKFFDYPDFVSLETYLSSMLINNGNKYQIVNINLDDVDDDFAKVITKIYSRLIFEFAKGLKERASIPFHIMVEEAHRYIQNDTDRFLIGYNIFERIAKEGRKYGVILGLISQRPVELSDTVISQCSNFLIFKMNHPVDVDYIRKMVPNISDEIVEKQKTLQAGTCLGFGMAFRIPLIVKMEMPNPAPWSGNCDVVTIWNGNGTVNSTINEPDVPVREENISSGLNEMNSNNNFTPVVPPVNNNLGSSSVIPDNNGNAGNSFTPIIPTGDSSNAGSNNNLGPSSVASDNNGNDSNNFMSMMSTGDSNNFMSMMPTGDSNNSSSNNNLGPSSVVSDNNGNASNNFMSMMSTGDSNNSSSNNNLGPSSVVSDNNGSNAPMNPFLEKDDDVITVPSVQNLNNNFENQQNTSNSDAMSNSSVTDNMLNNTQNSFVPTIGGYSLDNNIVQSSLPDFVSPSKQEIDNDQDQEFNPSKFLNVPSTLDMVSNNSVVTPTVQLETNVSDYGTVKIVPPVENNISSNDSFGFSTLGTESVTESTDNFVQPSNNNMVPKTDTGVPLINIVE